MAPKVDVLAAKQAKQKKMLIVLGVILAGALAFQLPKLLGEDTAAAPATDTTAAGAAGTPASSPGQVVAAPVTPKPGVTQLASFSLFEAKDPFVAKISPPKTDAREPSPTTTTGGSTPSTPPAVGGALVSSGSGSAPASGSGSAPAGGGSVTVKPELPKPAFATIAVNGVAAPLALKDVFPEEDELFVLAEAKQKAVKIGVAGGSLAKGKTATLSLGKKLTLVNTATGARYTLELLYVGAAPEQVQGFTSEAEAGAAAEAQTAPAPATPTP